MIYPNRDNDAISQAQKQINEGNEIVKAQQFLDETEKTKHRPDKYKCLSCGVTMTYNEKLDHCCEEFKKSLECLKCGSTSSQDHNCIQNLKETLGQI